MPEPGVDVQQELLEQSKRQTELLSQINLLMWTFAGVVLLAVVLLLVVR